ncbi:MAG: zf-TFIIB domain-containing protein [Armatimonadota bacterium]
MNCPVCDEKLREVEKYGVEIDVCPGCKGVWLDRGELEKMLQVVEGTPSAGVASSAPVQPVQREVPVYRQEHHDDHDRRRDDGHGRSSHGGQQPQRRKSLLGEILGSLGGGDD